MIRSRETQVSRAFHAVEMLLAVGAAVSAAELLVARQVLADDGPAGWQAARTRHTWMTGRLAPVLDGIFGERGARAIVAGRLAAAGSLLTFHDSPRIRATSSGYLAASGYALALRSPYGSDGSESMISVVATATALGRLAGDDDSRAIALRFIAAQSALSYGIAGIAKVISPLWHDGTAVRDVLRTRMFGHPTLFAAVRDRPRTTLALSRAVIVAELLFPLAAYGPPRVRIAAVTMMGGFHVANARIMGLNRFVWAFAATYPAVILGPRGTR